MIILRNSIQIGKIQLLNTDVKINNLFFSPMSISLCLGMTLLGARGETASELAAALALPAGPNRDAAVRDGSAALLRRIEHLACTEILIDIANGIFVQLDYPVWDILLTL